MELFGAISSGDQWRSSDLNGIYGSVHDQADHHDYHQFMSSDCDVPNNFDPNHIGASSLEIPFTIWPSCDSTIVHDIPSGNYGVLGLCEHRSANNMFLNIGCDDINHDWMNVNGQLQAQNVNGEESSGGQTSAAHVVPQLRWESERMAVVPDQPSIGLRSLSGNSKKRALSTMANDDQDSKSKRNVKSRKSSTQKIAPSDDEEDVNAGIKGTISPNSPLSAGEHSNASHEELGGTASTSSPKGPTVALMNLNGKARASRGSATDPQSVYARKRREKINERLRTLQNLIPNGTKVDISTMLEEAVQYVKFLQLQIKLLSSDDLWMYAPLAYNGMGIGLDLGLNSPRL